MQIRAAVADGCPHEVRRVAMLRDSLDGVTRTSQGRSVAAKSRRRPGIDYDGIPKSLGVVAIEPGDRAYRTVASTYLRGGSPGLVIQPRTPSEVADALAFARLPGVSFLPALRRSNVLGAIDLGLAPGLLPGRTGALRSWPPRPRRCT